MVEIGYIRSMDDRVEAGASKVLTPDSPPVPESQNRTYGPMQEQPKFTVSRRGLLGRVLAPLAVVTAASFFGRRQEPQSTPPAETNPTPIVANTSSDLEQHTISAIAATINGNNDDTPLSRNPQALQNTLEVARTTQTYNNNSDAAESDKIRQQIANAGSTPAKPNTGNPQVTK